MEGSLPTIERFKTVWTGCNRVGRRAYVTPLTATDFLAYGVYEPEGRVVFAFTGSLKRDLYVFKKQMESEGVSIIACYGPKVATDNNGRSVPSAIALEEAIRSPPIEEQLGDPPPPIP